MNAQHTPGPWRMDVEAEGVQGCRSIFADEQGICTTDGLYDDAEDLANARLIAAAPDGLALAYAVAEHFKDTDAPLGQQARDFITKATLEKS